MRKIQSKIILSVIICPIICTLLLGVTVFYFGNKKLTESASQEIIHKVQIEANDLILVTSKIEIAVNELANIVEIGFDKDFEKLLNPTYANQYQDNLRTIFEGTSKHIDGVKSFYARFYPHILPQPIDIFHADTGKGTIEQLIPTDLSMYSEDDIEHVGWFYGPLKAGKPLWLGPYYNNNINIYMISYIVPIYRNGQAVGIVGMDIDFRKIQDKIKEFKLYKTGYAFLLDNNYQFLSHPKFTEKDNMTQVEGGRLKSVTDKMIKEFDYLEYSLDGDNKMLAYRKLPTGQILVLTAPQSEVLESLVLLKYLICGVLLIGIGLSVILGWIMGRKISTPVLAAGNLLDKTKNLDLLEDGRYNYLLGLKDELGQMGKNLFAMRQTLRSIIGNVQEKALEITSSSNNLSIITSNSIERSGNVSRMSLEISKGAASQSNNLEESMKKLNRLSTNINEAIQTSKTVNSYIEKTNEANANGIGFITELIEAIRIYSELIMKVVEQVNTLDSKSANITEVTTTIKSIADQTNLLALNASIEAARAGEMGRGFAVVAGEISKLASMTSESTFKISQTIQEIQSEVNNTKNQISASNESMEKIYIISKNTQRSFITIEESTQSIVEKILAIIKNLERIGADKEELVVNVGEVSETVKQFTTTTEEITSSINEQSTDIVKISNTLNELKIIADVLKNTTDKFKV